MNLEYLTELKKNLTKDNHENIAICLRKLFNEKEDTNIKGKEFQYLNFLFSFDTSKYLYQMEKIYFMYMIHKNGLISHFYDKLTSTFIEEFNTWEQYMSWDIPECTLFNILTIVM